MSSRSRGSVLLVPLLVLALSPARASSTGASSAPATPLAPALVRAVERRDPEALADTTLPRLAALEPAQRLELATLLAAWPVPRRVAAWAFLQVGTPYRLGALGEERPPDPDPLVRFDSTDCAVLNLVSAALAHVHDAGGERAAMALAQYRGGRVSYETRFHFTTDRLDSSAYWRDVTRAVAGAAVRTTRVRLNRRAGGGRWVPVEWTRTREVVWLPRAQGPDFPSWFDRGRLPEAVGVAFVRRGALADGLDVVHESLLWRGRTLLHASSATGRVVALPWGDYLAGPGRGHDGFVLFEYR